jgi:GNAT superfamily N-acetyltransferase
MSDAAPVEPTIDLATIDDVPDLARLRWELYAEREGSRESLDAYQDRFVAFALQALSRDAWHAWVARGPSGPVAAMWLQTVQRVPVPGKTAGPIAYLTNVYVQPSHRDRGLGTRMLQHVLDHCRRHGYSCVITWPSARSRPFYRRAGFDRLDDPFVLELAPDPGLDRP